MIANSAKWVFEETPQAAAEGRLFAPAAGRNAGPLADVLAPLLPAEGAVLEIASGTGQHVLFFARTFPRLVWCPSDPDPQARESIEAWRRTGSLSNLKSPLALDVAEEGWAAGLAPVSVIVCINMIHIAPWRACLGLLRGAAALLPEGAPLVLYGPFRRAGHPTAPSNEAFDRSLRLRDPSWGLRALEAVEEAARPFGLRLAEVREMPANNLTVAFRRDRGTLASAETL